MPKIAVLPLGEDGSWPSRLEMLEHLKVQVGDELFATETDKGLHITRHDPEAKPAGDKP